MRFILCFLSAYILEKNKNSFFYVSVNFRVSLFINIFPKKMYVGNMKIKPNVRRHFAYFQRLDQASQFPCYWEALPKELGTNNCQSYLVPINGQAFSPSSGALCCLVQPELISHDYYSKNVVVHVFFPEKETHA